MRKLDKPLTTEVGKGSKNKNSRRGKSFGYQVLGFGSGGTSLKYIEATGGCVTFDGAFKIHTFNSPGTFCVSAIGCCKTPSTFADKISYVVIGGGGSSGGWNGAEAGGGGAGGFRANNASAGGCFSPVSPLANPVGAFTVSVQGYPIGVGSGGPAVSGAGIQGTDGSASSGFSISSAGGGGGGSGTNPTSNPGRPGGSGGGGGGQGGTQPGGSGNNPPTNPPQGQPGAPGTPPPGAGGTGGGAGGTGQHSWPRPFNYNPTPHGITGSDVSYASGGPSNTMGGQPGCGKNAGGTGGVIVRYKFKGT